MKREAVGGTGGAVCVSLAALQWFGAGPDDGRNPETAWKDVTACSRKASETAAFSHPEPQAEAGPGMGAGSTTRHPCLLPTT